MKNKKRTLAAMGLVGAMLLTGCSGQTAGQSTGEDGSSTTASGEKQTLTIYNSIGMGEYFESILIPAFREAYGDQYDIQYETSGEADVVTKIEAQGLEKGNGNINVVITGQNGMTSGNEKGLFLPLEDYADRLRVDKLNDVSAEVYEQFDTCALPILFQHQDAGIAYMPETEIGKQLDAVVGEDGEITYPELLSFMQESGAVLGRGRISNSGAGDCLSWGSQMSNGEYGPNEVPEKTIAQWESLYANGNIALYDGTSITFTELTEGTVDIIPHSLPWFYRLYAIGNMENRPENLDEDTKGLENAKFALMSGEGVETLLSGNYYAIPANLSDEAVEAALTFIEFATTPEMNANVYAGIAMPAYTDATFDKATDDYAKTVWGEVSKYYPAEYQDENHNLVVTGPYETYVTDIATINTYRTAWQDNLEKLIK